MFGRLGDLIGRKHTFLATILIMGLSTIAIGLLPTYAQVGILSPSLLVFVRMLQGLALGGEYGGAATYIAEHSPASQRGARTAWLQTSATIGFALSILVVLCMQSLLTPDQFTHWGWRALFIASAVPLAISIWIRLKLDESPLFLQMKRENALSKSPIRESLGEWKNLKRVLIAIFGMVVPQSVLLVGAQIYSLVFLTSTIKVEPQIANALVLAAVVLALPSFILSGRLSDRFGTKPFILGACLMGALTFMPLYKALTFYANPALYIAQQTVPITVEASPVECSVQFNPLGTMAFDSACDIATSALVKFGAPYSNIALPPGSSTLVRIGPKVLPVVENGAAPDRKNFAVLLGSALKDAGYPPAASRNTINYPMVLLILATLSSVAGMIFGPLASAMTSFFPQRSRWRSRQVPATSTAVSGTRYSSPPSAVSSRRSSCRRGAPWRSKPPCWTCRMRPNVPRIHALKRRCVL